MKNYGGDEAADNLLVAVGCHEKLEKIVHNVCLLNNYCYLCDVGGAFNPFRDTSPIPAKAFALAFLFKLVTQFLCFLCLGIKLRERSPCVHREHCFLFGDVASGKRTDLCVHGSP